MADKEKQHLLICDVVRVAHELGRIPKRDEYLKLGKFGNYALVKEFGSYTHMMHASGLEYTRGKKDPQENKKEAFEHLQIEVEEKKKIIAQPPIVASKVLVIGDTHYPYQHPDATNWLIALNKKYGFDLVLHASDEVDYHALNFHDHDPDHFSPGHELDAAIRMMEPLYKEFPVVHLVDSNHGSMVYRRAKTHGLPRKVLRSYREILSAPLGWTWHEKFKFQTSDGSMNLLVHYLGGVAVSVAKTRGLNVIQGHMHEKFEISYFHNEEKNVFLYGAQTGCLVDDTAYAMAYNKTNKFRPILGSLAIFDGVPKLLPMFLDKNGRWNGNLP